MCIILGNKSIEYSLKRLVAHMKTVNLLAFNEDYDGRALYCLLKGCQYIDEVMFFCRRSLITGIKMICF